MAEEQVKQYVATVLTTVPAGFAEDRIYHFSDGRMQPAGRSGLIVQIAPFEAPAWIGIFSHDYRSPAAITQLVEFTSSPILCVVAGGQGYILRADSPASAVPIGVYPVVCSLQTKDRSLAVFADFTSLSIVDSDGSTWTTPEISYDGVELMEITPLTIKGVGWDPASNAKVPFIVDLENRTVLGGTTGSLP